MTCGDRNGASDDRIPDFPVIHYAFPVDRSVFPVSAAPSSRVLQSAG
ncbi:hypothetical protein [Domibacillus enclensis]|nr:hypothetical protein [Domibacillus enclensis]